MRILLRADGGAHAGMGHIGRMLSLSEFLPEDAETLFVLGKHDEGAARLVERGGMELHLLGDYGEKEEAEELAKLVRERGKFGWMVTDRLNEWYSEGYFPLMRKAAGAGMLAIDDLGGKRIAADYVVNGSAVERWHRYPPGTGKVLSGPEYMVLGRKFAQLNRRRRAFGKARRILITVGGSDPDGLSAKICGCISKIKGELEFKVLATSAFAPKAMEELKGVSRRDSRFAVVENAENVPELLFSADLAIACAGVTAYELACVGTPAILLGKVEHQLETAAALEKSGFGVSLGSAATLDCGELLQVAEGLLENAQKRKVFSERGKKLVDGRGGERIASLLGA